MAQERTLVLIKPDAVQRGLAGEILGRFERRGLQMRAAKLLTVDRELAEQHYAEHEEKPFFGELVDFITSAPTLALVLEGEGAIATVRTTMGATNPADATPGSIRADLALSMPDNLVHGSDSPESAAAGDRALVPRCPPSEQALRNREHWDKQVDEYQAVHGPQLNVDELIWGAWSIPESELARSARSRGRTSSSSAAAPPAGRSSWRGAAPGRSGSTTRRGSSSTRAG